MNFEKTILKTLFYDYPIEEAVKHLGEDSSADGILSMFPMVARWVDPSYTVSEMENLRLYVLDKDREGCASVFEKCLKWLSKVAKEFLTVDSEGALRLEFDNLLRWHELTLLLGEDMLTMAYLADRSCKDKLPAKSFAWKEQITHCNENLNIVLKEGLSDVHAHFNASADVFHLNWVAMMNRPYEALSGSLKHEYQDSRISLSTIDRHYTFRSICQAAVYLRTLLFRQLCLNEQIDKAEYTNVIRLLEGEPLYDKIKSVLARLNIGCYRSIENRSIDYAILPQYVEEECICNDNITFIGERRLLYNALSVVYGGINGAVDVCAYVYLYLLLKCRIRRELIQTNELVGFENFSYYQDRKGCFIPEDCPISDNYHKFVMQNTVGERLQDKIEARVTPDAVSKLQEKDMKRGIFSQQTNYDASKQLTLVAHFIKPKDMDLRQGTENEGSLRFGNYRKKLKRDIQGLVRLNEQQRLFVRRKGKKEVAYPMFVGIDAASSELKCRPEVFGQTYRYAKKAGLVNRTYHVGEDFYDLVDGLRAIDEAIVFLDLDHFCRLGHALALGTDAELYYNKRHMSCVLPKQNLLDNCVWLLMRSGELGVSIPARQRSMLFQRAQNLYSDIGYQNTFDIAQYWNSMLLRSDNLSESDEPTIWNRASTCDDERIMSVRNNEVVYGLAREYQMSEYIKRKGEETEKIKYSHEIIDVVTQMQEKMMDIVSRKRIQIECCPSSNLKIGHFDRYDQHPILRFYPIERDAHTRELSVSINTDDRGVFGTSLYNEFSLMTLALLKIKDPNTHKPIYNEEHILDYIDRIRENGFKQRFK